MTFDSVNHIYLHNGEEYQSVSSWINQFIPNFESDKISKAVADKQGVEQKQILDKWGHKRDISLHLGNWVHKSIEYYLKHDKDFENPPVKAFKEKQTDNKYHSEVIVFSELKKVAGTVDAIESISKGKVKIHDFKTNEDLDKGHGKLLAPYNHLDNTPSNKYGLQLNKYAELLTEMTGVEVEGLYIWHYDSNTNKFKIIEIEQWTKNKQK